MAAAKSGHAEAELLSGSATYKPGEALKVGVRLKVEKGWHSYWINPGEGGMPLKAVWTLPEGWQAGELQQPVPKRFMTGDLPGFGYEGEAVFLVDLTPPLAAKGDAECKVKLSWLTCDDSACVPGDVELSMRLPAGDAAAGSDAAVLATAAKKIPQTAPDTTLTVTEADGLLTLNLAAPAELDLTGGAVFPVTREVVDAAAPITFVRGKDAWTATVKKNEYADGPATLLSIVIAGGKLSQPLTVTWRSEK